MASLSDEAGRERGMSKTCDRCGKELTDRDRTTICLECEVALAEEENERLETENAALWKKIGEAVKYVDSIEIYLEYLRPKYLEKKMEERRGEQEGEKG